MALKPTSIDTAIELRMNNEIQKNALSDNPLRCFALKESSYSIEANQITEAVS